MLRIAACKGSGRGIGVVSYGWQSGQNSAPKLDDECDYLIGGFANDDFFPSGERENSVGCILDELDEIGVDREPLAI